jgi:hypothetical protein
MMASARLLELHLSWITAWVPTTSAASPLATSASISVRSFFFWLPVSQATRWPRGASSGSSQPISLRKVLLGQDFGGRHQRALPAGIDGNGGGQRRHHGFAGAHIALQQAVHGHGAGQVAGDLFAHARWAAVSWKGSAASSCSCRPPGRPGVAAAGARRASRSRLLCSCDSCWASSSSAFRRCQAGWLWSSSVASDTSGVGWCKNDSASRRFHAGWWPF